MKKMIQARISSATGRCQRPTLEELARTRPGMLTEEDREQLRLRREALTRAQELMRVTELPEGVELHSEVDEEESLRREQEMRRLEEELEGELEEELEEVPRGTQSSVDSVDEESGSPGKEEDGGQLEEFLELLQREVDAIKPSRITSSFLKPKKIVTPKKTTTPKRATPRKS
jgi:hypothetical protein